ncbi:hypothetical protein N9L47_02870 [Rhodobacteraceae bacterium]|nr:hypothetical protein [Paracoccaceae bacterium]
MTFKRIFLFLVLAYVLAYAVIRTTQSEVWAKDGNTYVIYPSSTLFVYAAFRPLAYLDEKLTGRRSSVGPKT